MALSDASAHPSSRIGALTRAEPDLLISAGCGAHALYGAVWSHGPIQAVVAGLEHHAIALHLGGSTLVEKWRDGRLIGHCARVGSVSLVPARVSSSWVLSGHSRVAHIYVDPQRLADVAANQDGPPCTPALADFFADDDVAAASLIRAMLAQARSGTLDGLAHDELMAMLLRHLLRRHAADGPTPAVPPRITLTAATLRRLFDHIEQGLDSSLRLRDLAAQARLSDDHFLRAFRAAVGQTPHRYVLGRRIALAQRLLDRTALPIVAVAQRTGFRGASHFAAAFRQHVGATPSAWRAQRRH